MYFPFISILYIVDYMKKSEGINTICKIIKFLNAHVSSYKNTDFSEIW